MTAEIRPQVPTTLPRQFVSLEAVAEAAGVTTEVAFEWVRTGRLRAIRLLGSQWRVERSVLEAFLRARPATLTAVQPVA